MRLVFRLYKLIRFGVYHLIKKMKDISKEGFVFAFPLPAPVSVRSCTPSIGSPGSLSIPKQKHNLEQEPGK